MECLYCKSPQARILREEDGEFFLFKNMRCFACGKQWKDFEGKADAPSPVLSIQRLPSVPNDKSPSE